MDEHIELLKTLQEECDLLPSTIDAYTRLNRYEEAAVGIKKSIEAGTSKLNGLPVVNHGVAACRRLTETLQKPLQIRHGTPDARLLAEISMCIHEYTLNKSSCRKGTNNEFPEAYISK